MEMKCFRLTENARALDGLEIFQELQISSFPKTVDVTKLLLIDFDPIVQAGIGKIMNVTYNKSMLSFFITDTTKLNIFVTFDEKIIE